MYAFHTRVRYSECNEKSEATLTALLDYLQDCCTFQSEDIGVGVDYLIEHQVAWMLSSWQVDILRYPRLGECLEICTWPYDFKGFYGMRNFEIRDGEGATILKANSVWVFIDLATGKPARPSEQMYQAYALEEALDMEYLGRKLPAVPEGEPQPAVKVSSSFIDTNHHVNNAKYILIGQEFLPTNYRVSRLWAEYKKAAVLGDTICPSVSAEDGRIGIRLADEAGNVYVNAYFYGQEEK